jgi:FkbM family methyltransferase
MIPDDMVLPILQGALRGKKWISGSGDHGCWLGSYEYDKQRLFARSISSGDVVFDIGAHAGLYTLLASTLVGRTGRVIAFEPLPYNLAHLQKHLRINGIGNVQVVEAAVSDSVGHARFEIGDGSTTGKLSTAGAFAVRTVSLDSLFSAGQVPIPSVIKMDIEGGEYKALLGAGRMLEQHHPVIFLATHGRDVHNNCCKYLSSIGYELSAIAGESVADADELLAMFNSQAQQHSEFSAGGS